MRVVVEGPSDEGAARRIVEASGHVVTDLRAVGGKTKLDPKILNYARAARVEPWVVFRDSDNECPVQLRDRLLNTVAATNQRFQLRIAHTMTEAWLMADPASFSQYFKVSRGKIPLSPESVPHAKQTLLALCLASRSRTIREEVAHDETTAGPLFTEHINEFARMHWDVGVAATNSPSLRRALAALSEMPKGICP